MNTATLQKLRPFAPGAICLAAVLVFGGRTQIGAAPQVTKTNPHSDSLMKFQKAVKAYVDLHKGVAAQITPLKTTYSSAKIAEYQSALAANIREKRENAKQGDLFAPPVADEFRRLIEISLRDSQGARIRASLRRGAPADIRLAVNGVYPASVPLETTPASLLHNLPRLPPEVDYRIVGNSLILRDVTANMIVDFIPNAIP